MKFLIGDWNCRSHWRGRKDHSWTELYTLDYEKHYVKDHVVELPHRGARIGTLIEDSWATYDRENKRWWYTGLNNDGAPDVSTSKGWTGNTLTWTSVGAMEKGRPLNYRYVFTKLSDVKYTYAFEQYNESAHSWKAGGLQMCVKGSD